MYAHKVLANEHARDRKGWERQPWEELLDRDANTRTAFFLAGVVWDLGWQHTGGTTGNWETDPRTDGRLIDDGGESQSAGDGLIKKSH